MANIAITKYCNLNCAYCFAETMLEERETKNITIPQFKKILQWINKTPNNERIGIIGGEPTLHPEFSKILFILTHFCETTHRPSIIFTNGVYLKPYLNQIGRNTSVLINVNTPRDMNKEQYDSMLETLDLLYQHNKIQTINAQYSIGCNLTMDIDDYDFFWNIVKKYEIPQVRMSVVSPVQDKYKNDKELYYSNMKPIFLKFVRTAKELNVKLHPDCSQIPCCYFSDSELKLISSIVENYGQTICEPVVDITADFKACSCFGTYDLIDCSLFDTLDELKRYLNYKINYVRCLNNNQNEKCKLCEQHKLLKCQGGCLAFSKMDNII